jgi:hypothetical protein
MLSAAPLEADWTSKSGNRSILLWSFRSLEEFEIAAKRAIEVPGQQNAIRRLYLCQWTEQASRWLPMDAWDEGAMAPVAAEGDVCYAGLDLASTSDITALVLWFPREDGSVDIVPYFWVPEEGITERSRRNGVPYDRWARDGLIFKTSGNITDYDVIREFIRELPYEIRELAYDRWECPAVDYPVGRRWDEPHTDGAGFRVDVCAGEGV